MKTLTITIQKDVADYLDKKAIDAMKELHDAIKSITDEEVELKINVVE